MFPGGSEKQDGVKKSLLKGGREGVRLCEGEETESEKGDETKAMAGAYELGIK